MGVAKRVLVQKKAEAVNVLPQLREHSGQPGVDGRVRDTGSSAALFAAAFDSHNRK